MVAAEAPRLRRPRRVWRLWVVLVVALLVRGVWCAAAARRPDVFGDPFAYLHHADDIAAGRGYATFLIVRPTAYYPVGYPAIVGGAVWVARLAVGTVTPVQAAIAVNLLAGVATVWLTSALALRVAGARAARLAAWIVALFPGLVIYSATAHLETTFTALVMLFACLACCSVDLIPSKRRLVVLGTVLGASALVRPIVVPFVLVLAVVWRRAGWRRSLGATAVVAAVAALVILPWSIRSTRAMGGFVAISTNTGDNLCTGHSAFSTGEYIDLSDHCWLGYDAVPSERLEVERDRTGTRDAIDYAVHHPATEVTLLFRKAWYLVAHDHEGVLAVESYGQEPFLAEHTRGLARVTADVWWWIVLVLAAIGSRSLWTRRCVSGRIVIGLAAVVLATPLAFFGGARFHVPAEPFLAIAAGVALTSTKGSSRLSARATTASSPASKQHPQPASRAPGESSAAKGDTPTS